MKKMILLIVPMFLVIGCAHTRPASLNLSSLKPESYTDTKNLNPDQRTEARDVQLDELSVKYSNVLAGAQGRLNTLKGQADRRSRYTLATSVAGIASGITASVLLVASPANAVWAAAFTGFSTGVLAFQSEMFEEGYSRQAIARIYDDTMKKMMAASEQYQTNRNSLIQGKTTLSTDDWNKFLALADGAIVRLYGATLFVPLAIGTPEDLAELKKDNADLKQQLEEIKAKIPTIQ